MYTADLDAMTSSPFFFVYISPRSQLETLALPPNPPEQVAKYTTGLAHHGSGNDEGFVV
jgi:hypothetical protein